jgi:NADPH:quinone reductase-like Zn-dependent oxidoreductase
MKRIQLPAAGAIDNLTETECDVPRPGRGQVLVRMQAASLNYRDLLMVKGQYGRTPPRPGLVPLSDGAGEVAEVGPEVTRFKAGDRVVGIFMQGWLGGEMTAEAQATALGGAIDGVLADYVLFDQQGLLPIPGPLSFREAACLPCAAVTAWNALFTARPIGPGDQVLVLGTGGVSVFAMQLAQLAGARVIATSSSDAKLAKMTSLGASDGINYRERPEWHAAVQELTGGQGVDHVVEVGGAGTLHRSLRSVRLGGMVSLIGVLTGIVDLNPMIILSRSLSVRGVFVGSRDMFAGMNAAILHHHLRPVIDRVFPMSEATEAFRHLESGTHLGKVVIDISAA